MNVLEEVYVRFKGVTHFDGIFYCWINTEWTSTVEPSYNDIGLYDISCIASDSLWYQLISPC
jgi:hypothetical protein